MLGVYKLFCDSKKSFFGNDNQSNEHYDNYDYNDKMKIVFSFEY